MPTEKWTDELLNEMRHKTDPPAEAAAAALFADQHHKDIFKKLHSMATNDAHVPEDFPVPLKDYFNEGFDDFTEEEKEKFDIASGIFEKYGYRIAGLLFFKSLPTGYMCPAPAHVLGTTKLLETQAARRVFETSQFLFDVSHTEWLDPKGKGVNSIKKVRLMHAGMRNMILSDPDRDWDAKVLGKPINQEDMVLTAQLFSLAVIDGLDKMGVRLSPEEQEAYFYKWKIVGRILGVHPDLEADSLEDAWALQNKILSRNIHEDNKDGPLLTHELIDVLHDHTPSFISHKSLEKVLYYFLNDPRAVPSLGIHQPGMLEKFSDKALYYMVHSWLWRKMFPHDSRAKAWYTPISRFMQKRVASRFGIKKVDHVDPNTDVMEMVCKHILSGMEKKAVLSSNREFTIREELISEWQLGSFAFNEADILDN